VLHAAPAVAATARFPLSHAANRRYHPPPLLIASLGNLLSNEDPMRILHSIYLLGLLQGVAIAQAADDAPPAAYPSTVQPAAGYTTLPAPRVATLAPAAPAPPATRPLSNSAPTPEALRDHELLRQKLAERDRLQREIDELRITTQTPEQIVVHLEMLEVNLTALRGLGLDFAGQTENGFVQSSVAELLGAGELRDFSHGAGDVAALLETLKQNDLARTLANPTVAMISGQPATWYTVAEYPVPAPPGSDDAVEFREVGTRLEVFAEALGDNRVRLRVNPRISRIGNSASLEINGVSVPSLNVREISTVCELSFGETAVLNGLVERRTEVSQSETGRTEKTIDIGVLFVVTPQAIQPTKSR
jgi:hypothetical protein